MPAGAAAEFADLCAKAKITKVLFVRHAASAPLHAGAAKRASAPHDWKQDDQMRVLTPKGLDQCAAAAPWFAKFQVRAMLSSPARRASETAVRMAALIETSEAKHDALYLRMVPGAHPAGMSATCEDLFDSLGYGPLRGFFAAQDGNGEQAFMSYADDVCSELAGALVACGDDGSTDTIAVFGHAVFLNAIAYKCAQAFHASNEAKEILLDMDLEETQGILISVEGEACVVSKLTA
ncbi:hypothetical protein M885DRAFT_542872 [Pelagophyceae sp. CCMP2097]|nr:hypothetical protein M885DRAFT_542872 [Pelagophyceae sp. CCMP2097]|mmetsp:Transcript_27684/g.93017  ORF Transcript_27684/g.93017 Transcript_27684/m.93017 type:complete len:236 (+) Transcript_27684:37-744(+)|eukprot:CAMPEP_0184259492 /NCGR_PEP_ID=MMETSP0977-20130417/11787_1 /TAXON_ID=483370 /ORGANISM="non described non described, Strain CCMP2097" /LENGTH=235 /DNA_ID=CAMNT_0026565145 /DNA_START=38 /DNA_END=745 /DNA_ORIENTATION=+